MKLKISNFAVPITCKTPLQQLVCQRFKLKNDEVIHFKILRQSIDARQRQQIRYLYQFLVELRTERPDLLQLSDVSAFEAPPPIEYVSWNQPFRPVVVGFGPAGMFAALYLARCNAHPIVIERGSPIELRKQEVADFLRTKKLNENSNVQFGEGGAGAFSDGKLNTNINNSLIHFVLEEFHRHGAPEDILYSATPHVGTDFLEKVVKNVREEVLELGGTIHFNTIFTDFEQTDNALNVLCTNNLRFETQHLLLCLGHSARDTIRHLHARGVAMEAKAFSMGVRIEHLQKSINEAQYGKSAALLPAASYRAVVHLPQRSVYTFCMCPGGTVMASSSEEKSIVTNGMSEKKRDKTNANSALLVNVEPSDFLTNSPMDGLVFQEKYEQLAFAVSGDYRAPCNLVGEFLQNRVAVAPRSVKPSYPHGVVFCDFNRCLPHFVVDALRSALPKFNQKVRGFASPDAVLTGIESRSSSPVRILRAENRQSNVAGIYPVGEGAGYAGGITSAAIDGLKTAMLIAQEHQCLKR